MLFPVELIEMCSASPTPDDLVLDPFAGIGSTLVAAKQLGLPAVGIEIDSAYREAIRKRLEGKAGL